jgi:hypothetical protein
MSKIITAWDARMDRVNADLKMQERDNRMAAKRAAKRGITEAEACALAVKAGPEYGTLCRKGRPVIYKIVNGEVVEIDPATLMEGGR